MSPDLQAITSELPHWTAAFLLVLARCGSAVMLLPGIGEAEAPAIIRAGISVALTFILLPLIASLIGPQPDSLILFGRMLIAEVITGLWLGWLARIIVLALPIAGQITSYFIGLSSVLQTDAGLGPGTTALSRLLALALPVAILNSRLYAMPLAGLTRSFEFIPPGRLIPPGVGTEQAVAATAEAFSLALRLASPFLVLSVIWHTALALLARLTPRLQIYFVAIPSQIIGGIIVLGLLITTVLAAWQSTIDSQLAALSGLR